MQRSGDVEVSVTVGVTAEHLWSYVEQIERHVDWMADAEAIHFETSQRRGAGTRFVCDTRIGPFRLADHMEITGWDPPRSMAVRHAGLITGSGRFTLEPAGDSSTRFTWTERLTFPWYFGGRIGARIVGQTVLKLVWRRNLTRLMQQVERAR